MSNHLAIATVTAVLRQLINDAVEGLIPGTLVEVSTVRPDRFGAANGVDAARTGVNIFLYQVAPNGAYRNADLPTRSVDGTLVNRPTAAVDLSYLISFFGVEGYLEPERLLGGTVAALHARPVLTRAQLETFVSAAQAASHSYHYLADSDLDESVELVKFTPLPLSLEELSRLWSIFFQTPYALSVAYHATVVLLDSPDRPGRALPVGRPEAGAVGADAMAIEAAQSADGPSKSIVAGATLLLLGRGFVADGLRVRIGGQVVEPDEVDARAVKVTLAEPPLPSGTLQAGVQAVQILRLHSVGDPPVERLGVSSPPFAFVLRPKIGKTGGTYDVQKIGASGQVDGTWNLTLRVRLDPALGPRQRATVLLNESAPATLPGQSYGFDALTSTLATNPVDFPLRQVQPGEYLVRVQVDGAESELETDTSGRYALPQVVIP